MGLSFIAKQQISNVSSFSYRNDEHSKTLSFSNFLVPEQPAINKYSQRILTINKDLEKETTRLRLSHQEKQKIKEFVAKNFMEKLSKIPFTKLSFEIINNHTMILSILISQSSIVKVCFNLENPNETIFTFFHNIELKMNGLGTITNVFDEINELFPETEKPYSQQAKLSEKTSSFS